MLIVQANTNTLAAHFIGLCASLRLLRAGHAVRDAHEHQDQPAKLLLQQGGGRRSPAVCGGGRALILLKGGGQRCQLGLGHRTLLALDPLHLHGGFVFE